MGFSELLTLIIIFSLIGLIGSIALTIIGIYFLIKYIIYKIKNH